MKGHNISRLKLLSWINDLVETDYQKIENLSDGVAYCQVYFFYKVIDYLHPGEINLFKINFCSQYEVIKFKQDDFDKNLLIL